MGTSHHVRLFFIEPENPVQNGLIESFNGKLRNECLNVEWFSSALESQQHIELRSIHFNQFRSDSAFGNVLPEVWQRRHQVTELYTQMG